MEKVKIYLGRIYNPLDWHRFEYIPSGSVVVSDRGIILDYGEWKEVKERLSAVRIEGIQDFSDKLLTPGFIDLHIHSPQYDYMGRGRDRVLQWLENLIFPAEIRFKDPKIAKDIVSRLIDDLLKNGTTTAGFYSSICKESTEIVFEEARSKGIRAIVGKVMMDRNVPEELKEDTRKSIGESIQLCDKWHNTEGGRLMYAFSPRFPISCSKELLTSVGKIARESGAYIQSHLSGNADEVLLVKKLFPEYNNYTEVYEKMGILGRMTILGHAIHLEESEYGMLSSTGTKIAHCPSSNLFLKSGVMDLPKLRKANIVVGLGSDVGAGYDVSFFTIMRDALFIQEELDPVSVFYMATLNGAKALELDQKIGNFALGKEADFLVINYRSRYTGEDRSLGIADILSLLIYKGDDRVIEEVYVKGKQVFKQEKMEK